MPIALYHLDASAACEKVRLALEIEGIAYESLPVGEGDRPELLRISGQDEVPVLIEADGDGAL